MSTLPDLPSALIRVGLRDLAKVRALPERFVVNMGVWHMPGFDIGEQCTVCLAGSVMAMSLGIDDARYESPTHFDDPIRLKLKALNEFRQGDVAYGLRLMGFEHREDMFPSCDITSYQVDPDEFIRDMESLASDLEAAGL